MTRFFSIPLIGLLFMLSSSASYSQQDSSFMVGFYNLENLFDTVHDFRKKDSEYLPGNARDWDSTKYYEKLNHLARSIASMNHWEGPDVLGVCEVENAFCLTDLLQETQLKKLGYSFIHQESNDERGIDVACLYKESKFSLIEKEFIEIDFGEGERSTRDVLRVKFLSRNKDTLQILVNHWPSRYGGESKSAHKRLKVAQEVKEKVDSIFKKNGRENIILLGDFNDSPENLSIQALLGDDQRDSVTLFNTSYESYLQGKGTHKYQDEWNLFDQIIVSRTLLRKNTFHYVSQSFKIHDDKKWLSETDLIYGGEKPFRSYYGKTYIKGYSDHYAVSIKLKI